MITLAHQIRRILVQEVVISANPTQIFQAVTVSERYRRKCIDEFIDRIHISQHIDALAF